MWGGARVSDCWNDLKSTDRDVVQQTANCEERERIKERIFFQWCRIFSFEALSLSIGRQVNCINIQ